MRLPPDECQFASFSLLTTVLCCVSWCAAPTATTYEQNFQFVTVKGSGHMVPQFRPIPALVMFTHFINDTPF